MNTFADATRELEQLTGTPGRAGTGPMGDALDGVLLFDAKPNAGVELVTTHHARFRSAGAYLFVYEHGHGFRPDVVGIAPTEDKLDLVRRVQTDAANYGHDNDAVIAWLRELDRDEPFELIGAGLDFVEGGFTSPVRDRAKLAQRLYSFCPDFVDQGIGLTEEGEPHELIERYFSEHRFFFFWWD